MATAAMAKSGKKKKSSAKPADMDGLLSEVASFASSIGLSSSIPSSGFDDSDFRKTGAMIPPKPDPKQPISVAPRPNKTGGDMPVKPKNNPLDRIDLFDGDSKMLVKGKKLALMMATSPLGSWYEESSELEARLGKEVNLTAKSSMGLDEVKRVVESKKELARRLMMQYAEDYEARTRQGEWNLVRTAAKSGTTNDKVAALATLVGDNPVANLKSLDILLGLVNAKVGKRYAFKGFDHLAELFRTRLLPDRKLKCLLQRQVDKLPESADGHSLLLFWHWEECLKHRYEKFVAVLEEASKDMLPSLKDLAIKLLYGLLRSKMEQERKLLFALVNKLGDPVRKAASSAGYYLTCLLSEHPNMKLVVIEEVDAFIFRPHMGLRSKYHAVNFLSQILLSRKGDGAKVAKRLVDIYFALFKVLISSGLDKPEDGSAKKTSGALVKGGKKNNRDKILTSKSVNKEEKMESCVEMDSRLLCAILTGVNRAFPFVASDEADDIIEVQTPVLFRLVHSKNFNIGVQALLLLYQISSKNQILSDRFYRALYSKLLEPAALNSSKHEMFLALLFKALKSDLNLKRISAFSKRLLQISLQQPPQYACGCLCLISEVLKAKPHMWSMMLQSESADEDLEHFVDIREDEEEVADPATERIDRNLLTAENCELSSSDSKPKATNPSGDGTIDAKNERLKSDREAAEPCIVTSSTVRYNPHHREPSFCNAETAGWWELTLLAAHVHPSVGAMAQTLLSGVNIVYNGDPLNDLSLSAFLDKFMEKKPKASHRGEETWHGGSQIAPARKGDLNAVMIGEEILRLAENDVPPEDIIFHKFYANKTTSSKKKKKSKKKDMDEDEELAPVGSDGTDGSDDEEVENMLGLAPLASNDIDKGYDYEDLDEVAAEDDEELIGDEDIDLDDDDDYDEFAGTEDDFDSDEVDPDGNGDDFSALGDDDVWEDGSPQKQKKKKSHVSPFVSVEDFERNKDKYLDGSGSRKKRKSSPKLQNEEKKKKGKKKDK
ncbi:CCAAT-binding factor isoform X1 [Wolffia australiana]